MNQKSDCIWRLGREDLDEVRSFFDEINSSSIRRFFAPHPFTHDEASRVCQYMGRDMYCGLFHVVGAGRAPRMLAYGLARGFDDGFKRPSLGLCVRPGLQNQGMGREILSALLDYARAEGADEAILKVRPENISAVKLYESAGFQIETCAAEDGHLRYAISLTDRLQ